METKYEHLKFIIERFDNLYDAANNKSSFYIGLNTFIFGGVCVGYISLYKSLSTTGWIWALMILVFLCSLASIILTLMSSKPYLHDNHTNEDKPSLMFFGGIARHPLSYLKEKFNAQTSGQITEDALQQAHSLAMGLNIKYRRLKTAGHLLLAQFILLVPLFILIIHNLK